MTAPIILLPPSEGKAPGGRGAPWRDAKHEFTDLDEARSDVIVALVEAMAGDEAMRAKLLGVKGEALAAATAANLELDTSPTLPAIERFTGVLYDALDHASLDRTLRRRLGRQVLVFSGVFGVVTPNDPLPDHKCKMSATLPPLGRLATWWRPQLADVLARRTRRRTVWDLLPNEHRAAWAPSGKETRVLSVRFVDEVDRGRGVERVTVSHWNKLLKGELVRFLLATGATRTEELAEFRHSLGHRLDLEASTLDPAGSGEAVLVKPLT
ncbi:MAG: peroxide stress protein YaaA [Acidimicrobiales bacterium]|nr:peroxide stress protein YaaA [Acidimicrobiales bacterium]